MTEADQLLNQSLKIQQKLLKNNDEKLANTYFALADLLNARGMKDQAAKMKQEADSIMRRASTGAGRQESFTLEGRTWMQRV